MSFYEATDSIFFCRVLWVPERTALFTLDGGVHDVNSLRFTSGTTPANLLTASKVACCLPHIRVSAEVGCRTQSVDVLFTQLPAKSLSTVVIAGSLESAYSLNWGAREIWGKGGGETLALL